VHNTESNIMQVKDSWEQVTEVDDTADLSMMCSDISEVDPVSHKYFSAQHTVI